MVPIPILAHFFQTNANINVAPVGNGNINDSYRVEFEDAGLPKSYLLQRLNHVVFQNPEAVVANHRALARHLKGTDYPYQIPFLVPGADGICLQRDSEGNSWRAFPFFEGAFAPESAYTPAIAREAAKAYGAFLRSLRNFPAGKLVETIPDFHNTSRRWSAFEKIVAEDPVARAAAIQPEIEKIRAVKPIFDAVGALKMDGRLPRRVTHNDTKAGNVLLSSATHRAVAVIDWDTVMPGTVLSDFGDMVRTFAPDRYEDDPGSVGLRFDVLESLCRGFLAETAGFLTVTERENLPLGAAWIIGEQALRFLTDYLAGDVYYKIRFPEHNLVRARNQLSLLEKICAIDVGWWASVIT